MRPSLPSMGYGVRDQVSCCSVQQETGTTIPGPAKRRVSSLWPHVYHTLFLLAPEVVWATDTNIEPGCSRTKHMALSFSLDLDDILAPGGSTGHSTQDESGSSIASDTKATGCFPDCRLPCDIWWQHEPPSFLGLVFFPISSLLYYIKHSVCAFILHLSPWTMEL